MILRPTLLAVILAVQLLFGTASAGERLGFTVVVPAPDAEVGFGRTERLLAVFQSAEAYAESRPASDDCDRRCAATTVSSVDFTRHTLVLIALGAHGHGAQGVSVTSVTDAGDRIEVQYLEHRTTCEVVLGMPALPAVAVLIPKTNKPVHFLRERADVLCDSATRVQ